jgi:hypothetical protein
MAEQSKSKQNGSRRRKLPWTYWPIVFVMLLIVMILAAMVGVALGINPYIAATIGGGLYALGQTWLAAKGWRW